MYFTDTGTVLTAKIYKYGWKLQDLQREPTQMPEHPFQTTKEIPKEGNFFDADICRLSL
jgi:hypothetical protein